MTRLSVGNGLSKVSQATSLYGIDHRSKHSRKTSISKTVRKDDFITTSQTGKSNIVRCMDQQTFTFAPDTIVMKIADHTNNVRRCTFGGEEVSCLVW
jgi:hypothetical protein